MIWPSSFLQSHIDIFPEGQFCAEVDGRIVGSARQPDSFSKT